MNEPTVLTARCDAVLTITLNRPGVLNALNAPMYTELARALMEAADRAVRAVVLTGAGRGFCAGGDLNSMEGDDPSHDLRYVDGCIRGLYHLDKPVIAAINGVVAGGGLALALACDWRLSADSARWVPSFLQAGLVPDLGSSWFLAHVLGQERALDWLSSGRKLEAAEARAWGLATEVVPAADLMPRAAALAAKLASGPTRAIGLTRGLLQQAASSSLDEQLGREADAQAMAGRTADYAEALAAFRARRAPKFTGR